MIKRCSSRLSVGLHLTLFIEQREYIGIFSPESGVRLSIHDRELKPFPEDDGLSIAPGFSTSVGIKQVHVISNLNAAMSSNKSII